MFALPRLLHRARPSRSILAGVITAVAVTTGVAAAQSDADAADAGAVASTVRIAVEGRPVDVTLPGGLDPTSPAPVLVVLHGYGGAGAWVVDRFGLDAAAEAAGIVTVVPAGTRDARGRTFWNAGRACCDFFGSGIDDPGFVARLVDHVGDALAGSVTVDPRRTYLFGLSNGSFLAYRVACTHPGRFAAIAGVAGAMDEGPGACPTPSPLGVLHVHGTADETIAETGGALATARYTGAKDTIERWRTVGACSAWTEGARIDLEPTLEGAETLPRTATCPGGVQVAWWQVQGGAHVPTVTEAFAPAVVAFLLDHALP